MTVRSLIFSWATRYVPQRIHTMIGASKFMAPLRNTIIRPKGEETVMDGRISFEELDFYFQAPLHAYVHAKRRGIEARLARMVMAVLWPGDICIDVGANCGFLSIIMGNSAGKSGTVVCCEASHATANILRHNIKKNDLDTICAVEEFAIGATNLDEVELPGIGRTKQITIDAIVQNHALKNVSLVKIDVDGGDYDVLLGARKTITSFRPIVIVEMAANQESILEYFKDLKYPFVVGMAGEPIVEGEWPPNLIASERELFFPPRGFFKKRTGTLSW